MIIPNYEVASTVGHAKSASIQGKEGRDHKQ